MHPLTKTKEVLQQVLAHSAKAVVVTGGEPLMYNHTSELKASYIETFIETSGAYKLTGEWDWICLSPKKTMLPLQRFIIKQMN